MQNECKENDNHLHTDYPIIGSGPQMFIKVYGYFVLQNKMQTSAIDCDRWITSLAFFVAIDHLGEFHRFCINLASLVQIYSIVCPKLNVDSGHYIKGVFMPLYFN